MKEKILKLNDIKNTNLQTVLEILLHSDGLSRTEISRKTGCGNTTVTRAVKELLKRGILIPGEKIVQQHGRPQQTLKFNPAGPSLIGISLEAERINGVVTDLRGEVRERKEVIFRQSPSRKEFLAAVSLVIRALKEKTKGRFVGIGAAAYGSYSGPKFKLENAAALPVLNGFELKPFLDCEAECEVTICGHMAAKMAFLTRMFPQFNTGAVMLISSGSGIGSLISEQGRFLFVRNNQSGEFGHTISVPDGIPCGCGRYGCLETVASIRSLLQNCRTSLGKPDLSFENLCCLFQSGDSRTVREVKVAASFLGMAIANQLNSYPMDQLIITGRMLELGNDFQSMLEEKINYMVFPAVKSGLSMHFIRSDYDNSLARGAAIFAERTADVLCSVD